MARPRQPPELAMTKPAKSTSFTPPVRRQERNTTGLQLTHQKPEAQTRPTPFLREAMVIPIPTVQTVENGPPARTAKPRGNGVLHFTAFAPFKFFSGPPHQFLSNQFPLVFLKKVSGLFNDFMFLVLRARDVSPEKQLAAPSNRIAVAKEC